MSLVLKYSRLSKDSRSPLMCSKTLTLFSLSSLTLLSKIVLSVSVVGSVDVAFFVEVVVTLKSWCFCQCESTKTRLCLSVNGFRLFLCFGFTFCYCFLLLVSPKKNISCVSRCLLSIVLPVVRRL